MSGIVSDNTDVESGLVKAASSAPTSAAGDPAVDRDESVGTRYINTTSGELFICTDATAGENVWKGQLGSTVEPPQYFGGRGLFAAGAYYSDLRLKEDIKFINKSPSGINIYSFKYKGEPGYYEGVMAQEVPSVSTVGEDGFLRVDYSKIDVNFKKIGGIYEYNY